MSGLGARSGDMPKHFRARTRSEGRANIPKLETTASRHDPSDETKSYYGRTCLAVGLNSSSGVNASSANKKPAGARIWKVGRGALQEEEGATESEVLGDGRLNWLASKTESKNPNFTSFFCL